MRRLRLHGYKTHHQSTVMRAVGTSGERRTQRIAQSESLQVSLYAVISDSFQYTHQVNAVFVFKSMRIIKEYEKISHRLFFRTYDEEFECKLRKESS